MADLKETAKRVFLRTLGNIEPGSVIQQKLQVDGDTLIIAGEQIALDAFKEVVLIGMGKASVKMGAAVEALLGDRIKRGILVTDRRSSTRVRSEIIVAGHPLPDANSLRAAEKISELVQSCGDDALIIFLISGGGSSLVELPLSNRISLDDLRLTNQLLVNCGASIRDINVVRKNLSQIKGGRLGYLARNSRCVALYLSDVNPGDIRSIASNPLLLDEAGAEDFFEVVNRFDLMDKLPRSVVDAVRRENPFGFASDREWTEPVAVLLLDNSNAVQAAAELTAEYGFRVEVDADLIEGDYKWIADRSIDHLLRLRSSFPGARVCVISGGEVSCTVRGNGIGGRNQEFVLYSAARLASSGIREGAAVLSCGTDGIDGNSKAAGAVADAELVIEAARLSVGASAFISGNDSHSFFKKMGGLVVTGPTGNNVRDLRILMAQ
jgi:glycerate-2-kinase